MQLSATLVKGKARIKFDAPKGTYTLARAQQSFRSLVHIHEKNGKFEHLFSINVLHTFNCLNYKTILAEFNTNIWAFLKPTGLLGNLNIVIDKKCGKIIKNQIASIGIKKNIRSVKY